MKTKGLETNREDVSEPRAHKKHGKVRPPRRGYSKGNMGGQNWDWDKKANTRHIHQTSSTSPSNCYPAKRPTTPCLRAPTRGRSGPCRRPLPSHKKARDARFSTTPSRSFARRLLRIFRSTSTGTVNSPGGTEAKSFTVSRRTGNPRAFSSSD